MSWYMLAVKLMGALELAFCIVTLHIGQAAPILNGLAFIALCWVVYRREGWIGERSIRIQIFNIDVKELEQ